MSTTAKTVLWVVAAVVVIGGIWWWIASGQTAVSPTSYPTGQAQSQSSTTPTATAQPAAPSNAISATDNSNAGLQANLSNIDTQMNGFSSDNASVNQGMNDQPVQQSQF
jgi:hypothetical protein